MTSLPTADWHAALTEMETGLAAMLAALDGRVEPSITPPADTTGPTAPRLRDRLRQWDDRLTAAADLASSVERQVAAAEEVVGRWTASFTRWREMIERRGVTRSG